MYNSEFTLQEFDLLSLDFILKARLDRRICRFRFSLSRFLIANCLALPAVIQGVFQTFSEQNLSFIYLAFISIINAQAVNKR
jgi:hypothetical protein